MKEYIAETGGRFTYTDDVLNLQELALSYSALLDGCQNFVISGCEINGQDLSPGLVYINGKIRNFNGANHVKFPFYICERNYYETVTYANDVNKKGRCNYLCEGYSDLPEHIDNVMGLPPSYIEVNKNYTPRLIDKFFGKYALLINTPFSQQTIDKNLIVKGKFSVEKELESKYSVSVIDEAKSKALSLSINGKYGILGFLGKDNLFNAIQIHENGDIIFRENETEFAKFSKEYNVLKNLRVENLTCASIHFEGNSISNNYDSSDDGTININLNGYESKNNYYRTLNVYDGKNKNTPLFQVEGKNGRVNIFSPLYLVSKENGLILKNSFISKNNSNLLNYISYSDQDNNEIAKIGFTGKDDFDFSIGNNIGNIALKPTSFLNVEGALQIKGKDIDTIFVKIPDFNTSLNKKVDKESGKQLSQENFTTTLKNKLDAISEGKIKSEKEGYVKTSEVVSALNKKLNKADNLNDIVDKSKARSNINVFSKEESNNRFLKIANNLLELVSLSSEEAEGLTADEIIKIKEQKQELIRTNLDAEKKGTGDLKLSKSANLLDLSNIEQARKNIKVYSISEVDNLLNKKLDADSEYSGEVFTREHKEKLEGIKNGKF